MSGAAGLLIIANYNQEVEIGSLLDRVTASHGSDHVVVVDDGSTDRSPDIAAEKGYVVLRHLENRGIGAAIRTGIRHARAGRYDYVVIMSSNGKIQPEQIDLVTAPLLAGEADYVQGSRFLRRSDRRTVPPFRRLTIPLFTVFSSIVLRRRFTDITCGFRAYTLDLFEDPRVDLDQPWLDRYEMEYYVHYWACRTGLRIVEVPVEIVYDHLEKERQSKIKPFVDWWSMIRPFVYLSLHIKR